MHPPHAQWAGHYAAHVPSRGSEGGGGSGVDGGSASERDDVSVSDGGDGSEAERREGEDGDEELADGDGDGDDDDGQAEDGHGLHVHSGAGSRRSSVGSHGSVHGPGWTVGYPGPIPLPPYGHPGGWVYVAPTPPYGYSPSHYPHHPALHGTGGPGHFDPLPPPHPGVHGYQQDDGDGDGGFGSGGEGSGVEDRVSPPPESVRASVGANIWCWLFARAASAGP
jgi:hypothetical protein